MILCLKLEHFRMSPIAFADWRNEPLVVKGYAILWVFCRGAISVTDFNELVVNVLVLRRSAWERPLQAIETAGNVKYSQRED